METPSKDEQKLKPCQEKLKALEEKNVVLEDMVKTLWNDNAQLRAQNQWIPHLQHQLHHQQLRNTKLEIEALVIDDMISKTKKSNGTMEKLIEVATQLKEKNHVLEHQNEKMSRKLQNLKRTFDDAFGKNEEEEEDNSGDEEENEDEGEEEKEESAAEEEED